MLANMRPFSLTCIYGYAYTPRSANTYTRIHVYTYLPIYLPSVRKPDHNRTQVPRVDRMTLPRVNQVNCPLTTTLAESSV